jgi:hypothetical protein
MMQKLVLLSVILATFIVPARLVRRTDIHEYWTVLARFIAIVAAYVALLLVVYPRLS